MQRWAAAIVGVLEVQAAGVRVVQRWAAAIVLAVARPVAPRSGLRCLPR